MNGIGYRQHLRAVVAASAAPYGYTLTIWTAGAIVTHAEGVPSSLDALLLLAGAVLAFGAAGIFAFGDTTVLSPTTRPPIHVWDGMHLPSVGASILLITVLAHLVHGRLVWPLVGFTATATYLLVVGAQFWLAAHRAHDPEPMD